MITHRAIALLARRTIMSLCPLVFFGCDQTVENKKQPQVEPTPVASKQAAAPTSEAKRFVFPEKAGAFPEASVALDTTTGLLCKTYRWDDTLRYPKGLPVCSDLGAVSNGSLTGATKAYAGYTYRFDGTKWIKGNKAQRYNTETQGMDPWSEDQYDPLGLFSKEEKARHALSTEQIQKVADQFNVSYEEALNEAKQQGYQVPARR